MEAAPHYKKWLTEFLLMYKSCECLWDSEHEDYLNKKAKDDCYLKLVKKFNEHQPGTARDVRAKLTTCRKCYMREKRRLQLDPKRTPSLFYYDQLKFIDNVSGK